MTERSPLPMERARKARERYENAVKAERILRDGIASLERLARTTMSINGAEPQPLKSEKLDQALIELKALHRESVHEAADAHEAYFPYIKFLASS